MVSGWLFDLGVFVGDDFVYVAELLLGVFILLFLNSVAWIVLCARVVFLLRVFNYAL